MGPEDGGEEGGQHAAQHQVGVCAWRAVVGEDQRQRGWGWLVRVQEQGRRGRVVGIRLPAQHSTACTACTAQHSAQAGKHL